MATPACPIFSACSPAIVLRGSQAVLTTCAGREFAGLRKKRRAVAFVVIAKRNVAGALQQRSKPLAPPIKRLFPKVFAIELDQVEGVEADLIVVRARVKLPKSPWPPRSADSASSNRSRFA